MTNLLRSAALGALLAVAGATVEAQAYAVPTGRSADAGQSGPREGAAPPAARRTCPTRSWPNLAPRCVAQAPVPVASVAGGRS